MTFTNDELLLALVALVSATRPSMLHQDADGFSIDFEAIAAAENPRDSDRLLLKLGAAMQGAPPDEPQPDAPNPAAQGQGSAPEAEAPLAIDLNASEGRQIADALSKLELLQAWPHDVLNMSRSLRVRLTSQSAGPGAANGS